MIPVEPVSVIFAGEVPAQIAWFALTVPATDVGLTVMVTELEFASEHTPLVTNAR
jgi:hypothetical protein